MASVTTEKKNGSRAHLVTRLTNSIERSERMHKTGIKQHTTQYQKINMNAYIIMIEGLTRVRVKVSVFVVKEYNSNFYIIQEDISIFTQPRKLVMLREALNFFNYPFLTWGKEGINYQVLTFILMP